MKYDVTLRIDYAYGTPSVGGRHLVCLIPQGSGPDQSVSRAKLAIHPAPQERVDRQDFFGNQVTEFSFRAPHLAMSLTMTAQVERQAVPPDRSALSVPLGALGAALGAVHDVGALSPLHFLAPSFRVPRDPEIIAFGEDQQGAGQTVFDVVVAVGRALHRHMKFDAKATTVDTPASEAFAKARGVCQDFSHIMIGCLRGLGIPAGYVSGFLRTLPPPGKPRLQGADAMHAWVRAWCGPQGGWIDYDPTNACFAGADHICVAWGRDYSDVAPVKGTIRIAGGQTSKQAVDVVPLAE